MILNNTFLRILASENFSFLRMKKDGGLGGFERFFQYSNLVLRKAKLDAPYLIFYSAWRASKKGRKSEFFKRKKRKRKSFHSGCVGAKRKRNKCLRNDGMFLGLCRSLFANWKI